MTENGQQAEPGNDPEQLGRCTRRLDESVERLEQASDFAKWQYTGRVLEAARRLLVLREGPPVLLERVPSIVAAGLFTGSDWAHPERLLPALGAQTLKSGSTDLVILECVSHLRLLAIAEETHVNERVSPEHARHYLTQSLALNLDLLFDQLGEAERVRLGRLADAVVGLVRFLAERVGFEHLVERVHDEIWRLLAQRPIRVDHIQAMITRISAALNEEGVAAGAGARGMERLIGALYGPTQACREDPGVDVYRSRLESMDETGLAQEASGLSRAMHDTGLVSPYHATLLRYLPERDEALIPTALGLGGTGREAFLSHRELVLRLIEEAVHPVTAQAILGLANLLDEGRLFESSVPQALWRQVGLVPAPEVQKTLATMFGEAVSPATRLLAGVISMLGQPLGVGQGNNPTCQSARALAMWASNDPDYLLQLVAWAARDGEVVMNFEGATVSSTDAGGGMLQSTPLDLDPVSVVLVPHLDRIYVEMGRHCVARADDPHRWVNLEFHGWWVGRGFALAVDLASGALADHAGFARRFYGTYHPEYNGNQPVIHPQPAGVAMTDSHARFVGWHAIAVIRVAPDPEGVMRVYFFNPNNDSGQDWGNGVVVSTEGRGERHGEASLPIDEFTSRLYLFHYDPNEVGSEEAVPEDEIERVVKLSRESWALGR